MARTLLTNLTLAPISHGDGPLIDGELGDWHCRSGQAVLIENGRIIAIDDETMLREQHPDAALRDLGGLLLTPGLVDAHTHPAFIGTRAFEFQQRLQGASYEQILAAGGGIHNSVLALREASDQELFDATAQHLGWLKQHGVVACEAKSGYGLSLHDERRSLEAIHAAAKAHGMHVEGTCLAAHVVPHDYAGRKDDYLELICREILPTLSTEGLISAVDIFVEENAFSREDLRRIMLVAEELGLGTHVHADQLTAGEGADLAAKLGALSADHLEYTTTDTMDAMAEALVCAVMLPGSTFVLGQDQWAPAREFIERRVPLVLATDFNPGSSPVMNPAFIMSLGVLKLGLSAHEALAAFTRNAAFSLRIDDDFGSIAAGKRAAFTLWDCHAVEEIPYWVGANLATALIID